MVRSETILLTGINRIITMRIARDLLNAGDGVRRSLRSELCADDVCAARHPKLAQACALNRLGLMKADLMQDTGWPATMRLCTRLRRFLWTLPKMKMILFG